MIYLIRHAETEWNTLRRFQGKTDTPLSEKGRAQASGLAERMKDVKLEEIYCSPLIRAMDTAAPLAAQNGLEIIKRDELREIDFGRWEGLTLEQIRGKYPDELEKCRKDPYKYGFRFGLEFESVKGVINTFLRECVFGKEEKNIAVVTHSVILKMILLEYLGLSPEYVHRIYIENCSVSIIGRGFENNVVFKLNDTGVLS